MILVLADAIRMAFLLSFFLLLLYTRKRSPFFQKRVYSNGREGAPVWLLIGSNADDR